MGGGVAGCQDDQKSFFLPPCHPVTTSAASTHRDRREHSPITFVCLPKRAIEGHANDVVSIAPASEVGAESPPDCRGVVPGIRGESTAGQRLGSPSFVQVGIVNHVTHDFPVDTFVA